MAEREVGGRGESSISRSLWRKGSMCRTLDDPKYQTGEKPRDHGSGLRKEGHVTIMTCHQEQCQRPGWHSKFSTGRLLVQGFQDTVLHCACG